MHILEHQSIYILSVPFQWVVDVKFAYILESHQDHSMYGTFFCHSHTKSNNTGQEMSNQVSHLKLSLHRISSYRQEVPLQVFALLFGQVLLLTYLDYIVVGSIHTASWLLEEEKGSLG